MTIINFAEAENTASAFFMRKYAKFGLFVNFLHFCVLQQLLMYDTIVKEIKLCARALWENYGL